MNRLVTRSFAVVFVALVASLSASGGGRSKACHHCGRESHVKQVLRLVKVCEQVEIPSYVYAKEEVFCPDKGSVCHTAYRCDTFYDFWRSCDCSPASDALQHAEQHGLPPLHCDSHTVCGCTTYYGAKATGCHVGCRVRIPGKTQSIATPILKWEAVSLCKDCSAKHREKQ